MATTSCTGHTQSSLTFAISGLGFPVGDYDGFRFLLSGDTYRYSSTTSYTYTGLPYSTTFSCSAEAQWHGTWYSCGSASGTTDAPPAPSQPSGVSVSVSGLYATISFSKGSGADHTEIDYYWISGYPDATSYGSSFGVSVGSYNTTYYFDLRSVGSDGQTSGWTTTYSFTTGDPPPPPPPDPPYNISASVFGRDITINFSKGSGASTTELDMLWVPGSPNTSTGGASFSFSVTDWSTTYYYQLRSYATTGLYSSWTGSYSFSTGAIPVPDPPSSPANRTGRTSTSVSLSWGSAGGATGYKLRYRVSGSGSAYSYRTVSGTSDTIPSLASGTEYEVAVCGTNSYGDGAYTSSTYHYTYPAVPFISLSSKTHNAINIQVGVMSGNYDYVDIETDAAEYTYLAEAGEIVNFDGLQSSTEYTFRARSELFVEGVTLYSDYCDDLMVTTNAPPNPRPSNFAWYFAKVSGNNVNLTATEWNVFTASINEFRTYKSLTSYSFSTAVSGNDITAVIFNQALSAMDSLKANMAQPGLVPSTKYAGDDIYASYLNNIVTALNSIP